MVSVAVTTAVLAGVFFAKPLLTWWFKPPAIAILPIVNATGNPDNEYIADGLTESLITSLNQINNLGQRPRLLVTAQSTVLLFKGKDLDPRSVGIELGADTVVASRMIEQNGLWIIKVEMINVANGSQMWRKQYPITIRQRFDELMRIQDELASDIAGKLPLTLSAAESQRLTRRYTQNPSAYDAYLKGRAFWFKTTPEGYRSGQRDEANKILIQLQERANRGEYVLPLGIAWIYIGLGDKDQAFVWLDKSFEERSDGMRVIKTSPIYDPLRSDARFADLLKRMRLAS